MIFKTDKQDDLNQTTRLCPICGDVILTAEDVDATEAVYFDLRVILPKKETALIDIVERLRTGTWHDEPGRPRLDHNDLREAADEIEQLRAAMAEASDLLGLYNIIDGDPRVMMDLDTIEDARALLSPIRYSKTG